MNPYQSPSTENQPLVESRSSDNPTLENLAITTKAPERVPAKSPAGTVAPRYIAATLDNVLSLVMCVLVVKQLPEDWLVVQAIVAVLLYLAYFVLFETTLSATPCKLLVGLKVMDYNGKRCSFKQALIRTLFRIVEVNPLLLGALPAALRIVATRDKQRFGDKVADTIVVFR